MEANHSIKYDVEKSNERIDDILDTNDNNYEDVNEIPARSDLTFTNGYYMNVTSVFIDIVGSSDMTDENKRPTLAKKYRSFLSECVAIMNEQDICKEVNINGDCVWGVFETPYKSDIATIVTVIGKLNTLIKILNYKFSKKEYGEILVGIGASYGRALMIKAGYSGSGINDVVWMGDVINESCHLSNAAGRDGIDPILASYTIYNNLSDKNKKLFSKKEVDGITRYQGNFVNTSMNNWYKENCK
jgi:class 3 adenylate cyclase